MKKWEVIVTVDCTMSNVLTVEADTKEEAAEKGLELARREAMGWELNDCGNMDEPYYGDEDNDIQEVEPEEAAAQG